jgi:signal peptidase II
VINPTPENKARSAGGFQKWLLLAGIAALVIVIDQATKAYVVAHLDLHESWMPLDFLYPVFRFTLVHNTGAAFGIFPGGNPVFFVVSIVVSVVIIFYYYQLPADAWLIRIALGLQLGGALGNNIIDRIRLGYVIDFMHAEFWPVFNVADSCIVLGVVLLAFELLREELQTARQKPSDQDASPQENSLDSSEESSLYS